MFTSHNNHLIHDDDHRINIMSTLLNMIHHLLRHDSASWGWTVAKENSSKLFSISCRLCQHFHLYILCIINPCNCHHSFSLHQGRSSWCVLQLGQSFVASRGPFGRSRITSRKTWRLYHHDQNCIVGHKKNTT